MPVIVVDGPDVTDYSIVSVARRLTNQVKKIPHAKVYFMLPSSSSPPLPPPPGHSLLYFLPYLHPLTLVLDSVILLALASPFPHITI